MRLKKTKTCRGFQLIEFKDLYDSECNIQKSSLATQDAIWIGIANANPKIMASKTPQGGTGWVAYSISEDVSFTTRMHLTRQQTKKLLPILQKFVETGEIY